MKQAIPNKLVWGPQDLKNIFLVIVGATLTAMGIRFFVEAMQLLPSGFNGMSWLIVRVAKEFFNVSLSFSIIYFTLNVIPAIFVYKHIGRKFTILSLVHVSLVSILTTVLPVVHVTDDILLVCIFGGLFAASGTLASLKANASAGGTDFIAIYFSNKLNRPIWNYILAFNGGVLLISGLLFGIEAALYSIVYQFTSTQLINVFHDRYRLTALHIITKYPDEVSKNILSNVRRGVTAIDAIGKYSGSKQTLLYLVVSSQEADMLIKTVRKVDPLVFISETKTNRVYGNFYQQPFE
ncbi:MAG: YitT family protein [Erysipelothrix sp.]|nr:YitT family protein [Erysipelothrix sp.]